MKNLHVRLSANVAEFKQQMGAAGHATKDFGREMDQAARQSADSMNRIGKAGVVAGGLIVAGFGMMVGAAAKFETSMRNVSTISATTRSDFGGMSAAVLDLSRKVPQAATTLADGLYDIASSGFDGANALAVLEASAIAATAGLSDTATAARSITGILNAYGQGAEEAARVSDVLFQTVNVGVVTFEELAQGVGTWVGTAAALKIPIEDASAALATMTLSGINAAESHTALNRVMASFVDPSDAMGEAIRTLGYESGEAMVAELGLKGATEAISEAAGGSVQSLAEMYGEIRAIKGALALGAADGENYARVTEAMGDAAGSTARAYEEQSKSFSVQLDLAKSSISAFAIEIGTVFLPAATSVAQAVGSLADFISSLPGPLKTTVVIATGLAGVFMLVGGAALLAAPKIVSMKAALDTLAGSGTRTAAVMGGLQTSMAWLGKGVLIGAVLLGLNAIGDAVGSFISGGGQAAGDVGRLTEALTLFASSGRASGELAAQFGRDMEGFADVLKTTDDKMKDVEFFSRENVGNIFAGHNQGAADAREQIAALDESLAALLAQDPEAGEKAWNKLRREWEAAGGDADMLDEAFGKTNDQLDLNTEKTKVDAEAQAELNKQLKELGYNLDESSELAGMLPEELDKLKASTDPVIFSMLEMGTVTSEQAKQMQEDLTSFVDGVRSAFAEITSPLTIYGETLTEVNEAAEAAWLKGHESLEGFVAAGSLSLGEFIGGMQDTVKSTEQFMADIQTAITMGYDPQLIADLLQAGPEQAAPILETLLSDHSGNLVGLVNETQGKLRELNVAAAEMARLTHLATTSSSDQMVRDLSTAMALVQTNMATGGKLGAEGLARELKIGVDEVIRIAGAYGINLAAGLNPVLEGVGKERISYTRTLGLQTYATGGRVPGTGDFDTVPAMLTPGEFVIRKDAVKVIGIETLNDLNWADRKKYATGGFVSASAVPTPPSAAHRGNMVGYTGDASMDHLYEAVTSWVRDNAMVATGSTTGLDPAFLGMFNRYNEALGGVLSIISGFRSRAQQQRLYDRYMAGVPGQAPAAPPGRSNHERGLAIDHSPHSTAGMRARAGGFGLRYPMSYEPWHVEPIHIRDSGGPLMPGLTWNGTGRPEVVLPMSPQHFATGGIVKRAVGEVHQEYAEEQFGAYLGWRAGMDPAQLQAVGAAYRELADVAGASVARQLMSQRLGAEGYQAAARKIIDALEAQRAAEEAAAAERRRITDLRYEMGEISTDAYLKTLRRRLKGEKRYSEEWAAIWQQIESIEKERLDGALKYLDDLNSAIADRAEDLAGWADVTERVTVGWGNSVSSITANVKQQMAVFSEWQAALAAARERGVSEAVIDVLGLEEGPEALAQLRAFTAATDAELAELNAVVAAQQTQAGQQAAKEATDLNTALGMTIAEMGQAFRSEGGHTGYEFGNALAGGLWATVPAIKQAIQGVLAAGGSSILLSSTGGATAAPLVSVTLDVESMTALIRTEVNGVIDETSTDIEIAGSR